MVVYCSCRVLLLQASGVAGVPVGFERHPCCVVVQLGDKAAYAATRIARWAFDLISGYSPLKAAGKPITPDVYFLRFM